MINASEPDDSKFGNIAELTNGILARKENTSIQNLGIYRKNADYRNFGHTISYSDKAGGGAYSTALTLGVSKVYGVAIRVRPSIDEKLKVVVRDNLTGLTNMRVSLLGHYTQGEL